MPFILEMFDVPCLFFELEKQKGGIIGAQEVVSTDTGWGRIKGKN